jgi:hypothetical protein
MVYIVVMEDSLELVPRDGVDICKGAIVCLPPICCRTKELVRGKKNLLAICALGDTSFFSTPFSQSSASMGSLACEKVVGRVHRNSAKQEWCGGGGGGACCW